MSKKVDSLVIARKIATKKTKEQLGDSTIPQIDPANFKGSMKQEVYSCFVLLCDLLNDHSAVTTKMIYDALGHPEKHSAHNSQTNLHDSLYRFTCVSKVFRVLGMTFVRISTNPDKPESISISKNSGAYALAHGAKKPVRPSASDLKSAIEYINSRMGF